MNDLWENLPLAIDVFILAVSAGLLSPSFRAPPLTLYLVFSAAYVLLFLAMDLVHRRKRT
jgi:hypothetical protein